MATVSGNDQGFLVAYETLPIEIIYTILLEPGEASRSVVADLQVPADAVIDRAEFDVSVAPGGEVTLGSAAEVRAGASSSEVVADFKVMTTVRNLDGGNPAPVSVKRWDGVEYVTAAAGEIQTERLLLTYSQAADPAAVAVAGSVVLPSTPTGAELVVDGTTVWHERQGSTAGLVPGGTGPGVHARVDRTEELRQAFARSTGPEGAPDGPRTLRVELRTTTPGLLRLEPTVKMLRVHPVLFAEGASRTLSVASEGPLQLDLPLPEVSSTWTVQGVDLTVTAEVGEERVVPPEGPAPSADACLHLQPGRPVLARLPLGLLEQVGELRGVRVALRGRSGGGEVTGRFLLDAEGRPGEPVPGGDLVPTTIEESEQAGWVTLRAAGPVAADARWVELLLGYGVVDWQLTSSPVDDPEAPGTEIHLRRAGGAVRPLTVIESIGALHGRLRLVGVADANRPIPTLDLALASGGDRVPLVTGREGTSGSVRPSGELTPTGGLLPLVGSAWTAGSFTFSQVLVTYQEGTP
jgi:hypothetical protein